jgi:hypothetical protein
MMGFSPRRTLSKTPKTDRALDDVAGILRRLPASEVRRQELGDRVAEIRSVPSAVIRCESTLSVIDGLVRESTASQRHLAEKSRVDPAIGILASVLESLRRLRMGLEAEFNQARARAALGATGD